MRPAGARGGRGGNFARLRVFAHGVGPRGVGVGGARATSSSPSCCSWRRPRSRAHQPRLSPTLGGTVLTLVGDHFAGTAETYGAGTSHMCVFGAGTLTEVDVVSSGVARCEVPPRSFDGDAAMTLRLGEGAAGVTSAARGPATNSAAHTFYAQPKPESIDPMDAGSQGGTKIVVYGSLFQDVEHLACKVSTVGPILATFVDENAVACVMPARRPGTRAEPNAGAAPLEVSLNAVDYTGDNKTTVTFYREGPDLDAFDQGHDPRGGARADRGVHVHPGRARAHRAGHGRHGFRHRGRQLLRAADGVQVPNHAVARIIVNKFRLMCITPPMPAGFAAYEIIAGRFPKITEFGFQFHFHARARS